MGGKIIWMDMILVEYIFIEIRTRFIISHGLAESANLSF
jgi:hypothetical protein